ncbi:MAG: carbon-nitrogen hydrolase family protein [Lachnospiraceae bacterium]|nr:carbon-nitrogen hydrolase family protein [Lachnospiraceae bacterium]
MRFGLCTYESKNNVIAFNMAQIERALKESAGKVDCVIFGEAFLQGFDSLSWDIEKDRKVAVSTDSAEFKKLKELTIQYKSAIAFGYIESAGEDIYSSCAVIDNGELLHNYRRISVGWRERNVDKHYKEGMETAEFKLRGELLNIALCGDMWDYPEKFKTDGILIWPVYCNYEVEDWKTEEVEYAEQSKLAAKRVLLVNPMSKDPDSHGGAFFFEEGKIKAKAPYDEETILIVEI